jgi:predicted house-cleaning noncanonical NTP pyrophosphatase (MazG superfamily)
MITSCKKEIIYVSIVYYNKLVRDKIPDIIEAQGKQCNYEILDEIEYQTKLDEKLKEEINEYLNASSEEKITELVDIAEVLFAIIESQGMSIDEFDKIRKQKRKERGGFQKRILLKSVKE